ncbi:hypothetical protein [Nocardia wallacei]|uniref:hypothetical protein n=1 Tax=Nocardia wallacei TaxID=480035 RepID=UPI00245730D8|nr:hypothetical protein [Nocardia wallacei]
MIPGRVWGATSAELSAELPCDAELSGTVTVCDRAVGVDAPHGLVFAWLCQLRVAPYSYDLLDNFGRTSPRRRDRRLTELAIGQRFMGAFTLIGFAPAEHITLRGAGVAVTYATRPDGDGCRLHARVRFRGPAWLLAPVLIGDFVMMRKQLLTLRELAEREAVAPPARPISG